MVPPMNAIYQAESAPEIHAVRALFVEYAESLDYKLCFEDFEAELARLPGNYASLLLADQAGAVAGCAGLFDQGGGDCELRRLYVRSEFRGRALGRRLAEAILEAAREIGCARVTLETLPSMKAARNLYSDLGFTNADPADSAAADEPTDAPTVMRLVL